MNDRFKFRAWYTPTYSCEDDEKPHYVYDVEQIYDGFTDKGHSELGWVSSFGELLDNEEYILEQCTGLKDKNGKLIYEGDIVKSGKHIYPVKWYVNGFAVNDGYDYLIDNEEWEVIGNIHENKELLDE